MSLSPESESHETTVQLPGLNAVSEEELPSLLEALLLVAPDPVAVTDLADAAGVTVEAVEGAIAAMERRQDRGWVVIRHHDTVHFASAPRFSAQVRRLLRLDREPRLSGAALETLALIAYRQPVTRAEIESLRGVDCSGVLSTLHARGLIDIVGRLPSVGNPLQYGTSVEFLRQFGLRSLADLPPLDGLKEAVSGRLPAEYPGAGHGIAVSDVEDGKTFDPSESSSELSEPPLGQQT